MADERWVDRAACRGASVELFYSTEEDDVRRALSICAECPVRLPCRARAMAEREVFGVWGGTTEAERRRIFRRQRRKPAA